jgi:hypothetical protein
MKIETDDYVILKIEKSKSLAQIEKVSGDKITATLEQRRYERPITEEFFVKDIIAVLGARPQPGSVHGVTVEPYWKTVDHSMWGPVRLFHRMKKETWKSINEGLTLAYRLLEKKGLTGFIEEGNLTISIKPSRGKNLGMYYYRQKGDQSNDELMFRVQETQHKSLYKEVILHEAGHGIYYRLFTAAQRASWIKAHVRYCSFIKHEAAIVQTLGKKFIKSGMHPLSFASELDEQEEAIFHLAYKEMCSNYRLKKKHVEEIISSGKIEELQMMWPKTDIRYPEFEEVIGSYASTNAEELFAEAFRLYMTGVKLPKFLNAPMERHLASIK